MSVGNKSRICFVSWNGTQYHSHASSFLMDNFVCDSKACFLGQFRASISVANKSCLQFRQLEVGHNSLVPLFLFWNICLSSRLTNNFSFFFCISQLFLSDKMAGNRGVKAAASMKDVATDPFHILHARVDTIACSLRPTLPQDEKVGFWDSNPESISLVAAKPP